MATRDSIVDEIFVGSLLAIGPVFTVLTVAWWIDRKRRRESVFRPGQDPPTPTLGTGRS